MATTALTPRRVYRRPITYRPPIQRAPHLRLHLRSVETLGEIVGQEPSHTSDFNALLAQDTAPLDIAAVQRRMNGQADRHRTRHNQIPSRRMAIYATMALLLLTLVVFAGYQVFSDLPAEPTMIQGLRVE